jgi:hypothetical protein
MMAKSLKEKGVLELQAFQLRVHRQFGLGRIGATDFTVLHDGVKALLDYVEQMEEIDDMKGDEGASS